MHGFLKRFSILCLYVVLSVFCLTSCSEQSDQAVDAQKAPQAEQGQESRCTEVTRLFAMDNWDSIATGPFETNQMDNFTLIHAPARSMIAGSDKCTVSRNKVKGSFILSAFEFEVYGCSMPAPESASDDPLLIVKALADLWKSCVVGWEENSKLIPNSAILSFSEKEKTLGFSAVIGHVRLNTITLTRMKLRPPDTSR